MDLHSRFPGVDDLKKRAKQRVPRFAFEFLDSGTGQEATKARNRRELDRIGFDPSVLHGEFTPDLTTALGAQTLPLPFGIAPVGMSGLIWPGTERMLAQAGAKAGVPYCLSNVAAASPEDLAPHLGEHAWFQLYPPRDEDIRRDLLDRARRAGFSALIVTLDVPVASRRERQTRSGLTTPMRLTPRILAQIAARPAWALAMARAGSPQLRTLDKYAKPQPGLPSNAHVGYLLRTSPDWSYAAWLRDNWDGPLYFKGVLRAEDAARLQSLGADAIWVSNHAGRQFDGAPATIEVLPEIRAATTLPVIFDSGVESGLDVLRAFALGADLVMLGRAFHFAVAALGAAGPAHLIDVLTRDMASNMGQLGARDLGSLPPTRPLTPP